MVLTGVRWARGCLRRGRRPAPARGLQPFQAGEQGFLVGGGGRQQDLRAHQLEQQPGRGGAAHLI
jgi:hypothetical protein